MYRLHSHYKLLCFLFCLGFSGLTQAQVLNPVAWGQELGYCTSTSGPQTKCASNSWNNAYFKSKDSLDLAIEGQLEFEVKEVNSYKMLGFAYDRTSYHYSNLKHAIYQRKNKLAIYESGKRKTGYITLSVGDKLSIKKENGRIKYFHNSKLFYTSNLTANQEFYVVGVGYSNAALQNEVFASFVKPAPELYTTASLQTSHTDLHWTKKESYGFNSGLQTVVSQNGLASSYSKNQIQDLSSGTATLIPSLSSLFSTQFVNQDLNIFVGLITFPNNVPPTGLVPFDQLSFGFSFERTSEGRQTVFMIRDGRIIGELPPFTASSEYRIRIANGVIHLEQKLGRRYTSFYSQALDPSKDYHAYQGARGLNNPFIQLNQTGFSASKYVNYSFGYTGEEDLFDEFNNDFTAILNYTNQTQIKHRMTWTNSINIKNATPSMQLRTALRQDNPQSTGYAESVFYTEHDKTFSLPITYTNSNFSIGLKPYEQELTTNPFTNGYTVSNGVLSFNNQSSNLITQTLTADDVITFENNGDGTIQIAVNGNVLGLMNLPTGTYNVVASVDGGSLPANIAMTTNSNQNQAAAPPFTEIIASVKQVYTAMNTTCDPSQAVIDINYIDESQGVYLSIKDPLFQYTIDEGIYFINGQNPPMQIPIPVPLGPGVYGYELEFQSGQMMHGHFSISTPVEWNENNPSSSSVDFWNAEYDANPPISIIQSIGNGAFSYSNNNQNTPQSFAYSFAIYGDSRLAVHLTDANQNPLISITYDDQGGTDLCTISIPQNGITETFDFDNLMGGKISAYFIRHEFDTEIHFYRRINTSAEEPFYGIGIPNTSLDQIKYLKTDLLDVGQILKAASATFCEEYTATNVSIIESSTLAINLCGRKQLGNPTSMPPYQSPSYVCPSFSLIMTLQNLEPNTAFRVNNIIRGSTELLDYDDIISPVYNSMNYDFTTTPIGETPLPIIIETLYSDDIFSGEIYFELLNLTTNTISTHQFELTDEFSGLSSWMSECFSTYDSKFYNCLMDEDGQMEVNYDLIGANGGEEIDMDYDWSNNPDNTNPLNVDLETGCYTVASNLFNEDDNLTVCGLPEFYIPYKIMAETIWEDLGSNSILNEPTTYTGSKLAIENQTSTTSTAFSLNQLSNTEKGMIWYRNIYPADQSGQFGYLDAITQSEIGISLIPTTNTSSNYTHAIKVYISATNGFYQVLNPTIVELNQFEFIELVKENINGQDETAGVNITLNIYPEFSDESGLVEPRLSETYTFSNPVSNDYYTLFARPGQGQKLGEFGLNFCPAPTDVYYALMSRTLHDGRHELESCLEKEGYSACPVAITNKCDFDGLDLLKFKFDEDYYRSISTSEVLNFEVRDYENNVVINSSNAVGNAIVKLGDNRYQLSMSDLNSDHPYYILIVKNAKHEKRYLRFKK